MSARKASETDVSSIPNRTEAIVEALSNILKRCDELAPRLMPGEGGERSFRGWLVSDLLTNVLGWPTANTIVGERFDLTLQDADAFHVLTIETKAPRQKITKKDRKDFEDRLSTFGTLKHAYLTNGTEWERIDLATDERSKFNLESTTPELTEAFFTPLGAERHFGGVSRGTRHTVRRDNPHILKTLATDLDGLIGELASYLESLFPAFRDGNPGEQSQNVFKNLFNLWCDKALIVSPHQAGEALAEFFTRKERPTSKDIEKTVKVLGFAGSGVTAASDLLAVLPANVRTNAAKLADELWPLYDGAAKKLCAQTAHVVLARALLYRTCEDRASFPRLISREEMERAIFAKPATIVETPRPATNLLEQVRQSMSSLLPAIYSLGEFDWWLVTGDKRSTLKPTERAWVKQEDATLERILQRLLRILDGYSFEHVDVDVWRNVYQNYLPADERQQLGGFYTPDELVELTLDLADFKPENVDLCKLSFVDQASGSGAFVVTALARLLKHLELDLPCHRQLTAARAPWKRAEEVLKIAATNVHAVDIHPFAAFLTTVNVLFLLMPHYAAAREKNPDFSVDLQIFSSDSLEKHDADLFEPDLFSKLNARVQLTAESFEKYQEMLKKKFDRVFGNPPWGGVLKGHLAPVYDEAKKDRFKKEYPAAARGKYDVYGLFMERALQILNTNGRFALITQSGYVETSWAKGLRKLLAHQTHLRCIVDLNPFGQLFFGAMNGPCITVADVDKRVRATEQVDAILSLLQPFPQEVKKNDERRRYVVTTVTAALASLSGRHKSVTVEFASASRIPVKQLRESASSRWDLSTGAKPFKLPEGWLTVGDILSTAQGVTPGILDIFLMPKSDAVSRKIESDLLFPVVKGQEVVRWRTPPTSNILLYPYKVVGDKALPAFSLKGVRGIPQHIKQSIRAIGLKDGLDFDIPLDAFEQGILRRGINNATAAEILKHRIAARVVAYPEAAAHLTEHYEALEGRVVDKASMREFGKRWYEYHRQRNVKSILEEKIIGPRLTEKVCFSLDTKKSIPQDTCWALVPGAKTAANLNAFRERLAKAIGNDATDADVYKYCLAFLNSRFAQARLTAGRRPTPMGHFKVPKAFFREIPLPPPDEHAREIIGLVSKLLSLSSSSGIQDFENQLEALTSSLLSAG